MIMLRQGGIELFWIVQPVCVAAGGYGYKFGRRVPFPYPLRAGAVNISIAVGDRNFIRWCCLWLKYRVFDNCFGEAIHGRGFCMICQKRSISLNSIALVAVNGNKCFNGLLFQPN